MDYLKTVAELMAVAARTAPKSAGQDFVCIKIIQGGEITKLATAMTEYGKKTGKKNFDRDANNVRNSASVVLIGLKDAKAVGLNCGACGYTECKQLPSPTAERSGVPINIGEGLEFKGPQCAYRLLDLGIALGSAVKTASLLNADNRIMYRIGVAARQLKMIDADIVIGIPISATGKSIYFDR